MQPANPAPFDPGLKARLKRMGLRLEAPDPDTLTVKGVPANRRRFSKMMTNVLIRRSTEGMACFVCVDEDLEYRGEDPTLTQAFIAGHTQQGWRVLSFGGRLHEDLDQALEYALEFLGTEEGIVHDPAVVPSQRRKLLAALGENLTEAAGGGRSGATLFRDEEVEQAAACTLSWQGRLPLILGEAGTGKTNLLHGIAGRLAKRQREVLAVNMGAMMAGTLFESEREQLLAALLREARETEVVLAMEQAEWAMLGVPRAAVLLREALDRGTRLIATSAPKFLSRFVAGPLESRLEVVRLKEPCATDTQNVLKQLRPLLTAHHGIQIDGEIELAAVERSLAITGFLPGKAVGLLDAAAARASLIGSPAVTLLDVYMAASRMLDEAAP